ncbi:hypothetical protein M9Y10_000090 [Tritrichomonas musculus]|uniref:DUF3447 domain-containing protein n=1 Tax=Tritrichomonas musculus TaxID=1915356 RepID=A0ABR2L3C0_9EUKA
MDYQDYLKKMRDIQDGILECVENQEQEEESYQKLINLFENYKIRENKNALKEVLCLIVRITKNHYRNSDFFTIIERILSTFKDEITQNFSNYDIFNVFKSNKRLLLYLFEQKIITPNQTMASTISNGKYLKFYYPNFFYPEIKTFLSEKLTQEIEMTNCRLSEDREPIDTNSSSFEQKRKIGQNDDVLCQLIQNDSVDDFKSHVNKNNISLSSKIRASIYETNSFLLSKTPTLIEYSAFVGSIQIFNYLCSNQAEMTPSLWLYAIHSHNTEILDSLRKHHISPKDKTYKECVIESIECHHIEITNYLSKNFFKGKSVDDLNIFTQILKSYNFIYFPNEMESSFNSFFDLCQNNFVTLACQVLEKSKINMNSRRISFQKFV